MKEGDRTAFKIIVESYIDFAYSLAFRILGNSDESNDIVQESFIKVWEKRGSIRTEGTIEPWIRKIVINGCYDQLRRRKRAGQFSARFEFKDVSELLSSETADSGMEEEEYRQILENLTSLLSPKQRLVFVLSEIECMTHSEIETVTGLTKNSIKSNLTHARKRLKERFEGYEKLRRDNR